MYVCVCNAVTERQVYQAIEEGAKTVKDLSRKLGVGTECGSCVGCAKECLKNAAHQHHAHAPTNVIAIAQHSHPKGLAA